MYNIELACICSKWILDPQILHDLKKQLRVILGNNEIQKVQIYVADMIIIILNKYNPHNLMDISSIHSLNMYYISTWLGIYIVKYYL